MKSKLNLLISGLIFSALVSVIGCGRDSDAVIVDFEKTIVMERPDVLQQQSPALNVAVAAMISPRETLIYYQQILDYIGDKLNLDVHLIQRKTYEEVNILLGKGQIDLAFICSGPYANERQKYGFEALATPLVRDEPFYYSYLIVAKNSALQDFDDLRGRTFAFTDPDSNSGTLVPKFWLDQIGETPESYFGKTIYTYSHDNSILAVARSLVDGAAIDGHKWEYYNRHNPIYTAKTRIIKKSERFGSPPLVASKIVSDKQKDQIRETLYTMHLDPAGQKILSELLIDSFVPPKHEWYEPIRAMRRSLNRSETKSHASKKP